MRRENWRLLVAVVLESSRAEECPWEGDGLAVLKAKIKSEKRQISHLKKKSLWARSLEEVREKLVDIVLFLHLEIINVFDNTVLVVTAWGGQCEGSAQILCDCVHCMLMGNPLFLCGFVHFMLVGSCMKQLWGELSCLSAIHEFMSSLFCSSGVVLVWCSCWYCLEISSLRWKRRSLASPR
ncbi:hypothetical protein VNO80_02982 [Phaseolus coccineus]|uniref:Uncharacterized protein n=1 Tax=Phaseolus coccineus TaxID=3886 RepID=A0AAN9RM18_PHACN